MSAFAQACPRCGVANEVSPDQVGEELSCRSCGQAFVASAGATAGAAEDDPIALDITVSPSSAPGHQDTPRPELPGYELVDLLGKGGMGEVWKARQTSLDREVAVKILPARFASDPEFVARFEKETKALATLSHPNIVQIIDRGRAGEHYYFTMELVRGVNLREILRRGTSAREALRLSVQVARAITHAHHHRIVHRDLKPENVLVDPQGHVKIADFGLAGMPGHERNIALTATAVAMGTVNYMAPEQRRDAKHVDHRADLYSLGVLMYELFTGHLPLGRFRPASARVSGLDPRVDELIGQLLEAEPEARPADGATVVALLEEVIGSSPSLPRELVEAALPGAGRRRVILGVVALVAMLGAGLALRQLNGGGVSVGAPSRPPQWYQDSQGEVFSAVTEGPGSLDIDFTPAGAGGEKVNTHSGLWKLEGGQLVVTQFGESAEEGSLIPRAYLASRYFHAADFEASVDLSLEPLPDGFPPLDPATSTEFGELAFRIKDLQVSVFAIPSSDLRLSWRYFTRTGEEFAGSSAIEREALFEERVKVPRGVFRLKLKMTRLRGSDVNVEAFVNDVRFARKVLPGLGGQVGKLALGCRNLVCRFDNLKVSGKLTDRPTIPGKDSQP